MDDKDIDDSGQHMVGIADTKALNLTVFVLEQCMSMGGDLCQI